MKQLFTPFILLGLLGAAPVRAQSVFATSDIRQVTVKPGSTPVETMVSIGKGFAGKPFVAKTLDVAEDEQLVINFQEFDCTTFVETTLALAIAWQELTDKQDRARFNQLFNKALTRIRYRNGEMNGYASRLHYFSEWLQDNERKGLLQDVTGQLGGKQVSKPISFMTSYTQHYPQLSDSTTLKQIRDVEFRLSHQPFKFIPKAQIRAVENSLQEGDIIMFTAARPGLDMKHVGMAVWKNGRVHLLHASSEYGEVTITDQPMVDYVLAHKGLSGIRVARLKRAGQPNAMQASR